MKKIYMLMLIVALACPKVYSAPKTIVCQTKGQGVTREQAIDKALYQAVAQAGIEAATSPKKKAHSSAG